MATVIVGIGSKCLDVPHGATTVGTSILLYERNKGTNQQWTLNAENLLVSALDPNRCLGVESSSPERGQPIVLCDLAHGQKWTYNTDGTFTIASTNLCIDVDHGIDENGRAIILWDRSGAINQQWSFLVSPPGTSHSFTISGGILEKWISEKSDIGYLGFPVSDAMLTQGTNGFGKHQFFENGTIFWTPERGTIIKHTIVKIQKPETGDEQQIAFVLSGGGSRGDFQMGAVAALIESGINPDIIYSTSVGSLNGLMIAHGQTGLDTLRNIWFGLRRNEHMYIFEDWWKLMDQDVRNFLQSSINEDPEAEDVLKRKIILKALVPSIISILFDKISGILISGAILVNTLQKFLDVIQLMQNKARSVFNLNPVRDLFGIYVRPDLVNTWAKSGKGKKLRMATVGLESGELCYVTESGDLVDKNQQNVLAHGIPLVEGALASAAIGGVFVPPVFANDAWIDGGHRENIPLQGAIDSGARKIFVIPASPVSRYSAVNASEDGFKMEDYKTGKNVIDIALRSIVEISGDEIASNDIFSLIDGYGADIKLISPQFPTHFIITIDAELIRINYDYGYRCALDVLNNVPGYLREMSDQIAIKQAKVAMLKQKTFKAIGIPFSAEIKLLLSEIGELIKIRQQNNLSITGTPALQPIALGDTLQPGEILLPGQCITSADPGHQYTLLFNTNGNLQLYLRAGASLFGQPPVWQAPITLPEPGGICIMQLDGNLVVYNNQMKALWASETNHLDHYYGFLRVQSDGTVTLNKKDGGVFWSSSGVITPVSSPVCVTVKNNTAQNVNIRFYNIGDPHMGLLTTLWDGLRNVLANGMVSWPLPSGINSVKVTFNGNSGSARIVSAGETTNWDLDERIHLINKTSGDVRVRIFDGNQLFDPGGIALSNGELIIGGYQEKYWQMPDDILKVGILFNDTNPTTLWRGQRFEYALPEQRVYIENLSSAPVKIQFFNKGEHIGWASVSRLGEDINLSANGAAYYTIKDHATSVQIRFVQSGNSDQIVMAPLGSKFSYNANGTVTIPIFP